MSPSVHFVVHGGGHHFELGPRDTELGLHPVPCLWWEVADLCPLLVVLVTLASTLNRCKV